MNVEFVESPKPDVQITMTDEEAHYVEGWLRAANGDGTILTGPANALQKKLWAIL